MGTGVFITGTDTGVGKTVVTAGLLAALRRSGIDAVAFKPVQSGGVRKGNGGLASPDADFYLKAAGMSGEERDYNLYCLEPPLSPHLAAEMSGVTIDPGAILSRSREYLSNHRVLLVEGAGGICAPLNRDGYNMADLARDLGFPLVVVARPTLGTINHTLLTIHYARMKGLTVAGFIFNGPAGDQDFMVRDNAAVIESLTGAPLLGMLPHIRGLDVEGGRPGDLLEKALEHLCWREIGGII
ncbi:MAG: dethiobiotin synthase [Peptococcaceae bacterium]|nr:dethiobiotin synthase [Peptococcaceae bacterium]